MDEQVIQFAVREGIIDSADEVENLSELDKDCIETAYEAYLYSQGKRKIPCRAVTINEKGERVLGETYFAYIGESYEEAMAREANEGSKVK